MLLTKTVVRVCRLLGVAVVADADAVAADVADVADDHGAVVEADVAAAVVEVGAVCFDC